MDTPEWINYQNQFDLPPSYFQDIPKKTDKHCVIVEPRCHSRLVLVIKNFMYLLQKNNWGLIIFHSKENELFLKEALVEWPNIIYTVISEGNFHVDVYNDILCSNMFWRTLEIMGTKHALIFQVDTVLLKDNIDDFLEYDYVGAPWCCRWLGLDIGNGGLSLRNVISMRKITEECSRTVETFFGERYLNNEDIFFSFHLKFQPTISDTDISFVQYRLPSIETASQFSVETIFNDNPCGMHQPHIDKFPSYDDFAKIFSKRYINV